MLKRFGRALVSVLALFFVAAIAFDARATGSFRLKANSVQEVGGGWHIFCTLDIGKPPSLPHVPMKFYFTRVVAYELSLVDGHAEPVETRQTLTGQTPNIASMDVDFSNGSGKIFKGTSFDFSISRTQGYTPGEYQVKVQTVDGTPIGGTLNITLSRTTNHDDPNWKVDIVDRRSMNFTASSKGKDMKKVDNGVDAGLVAKNEDENAPMQNTDVQASGTAAPFIPPDAYQKTPEEQGLDHPKGCGCSAPGAAKWPSFAWLGAPLAAFAVARLRQRRRSSRPRG
jgi:MYXO-CTERM domain-containing protein